MSTSRSLAADRALRFGVAVGRWLRSFAVFVFVVAVGVFCLPLLMPGDPAERVLATALADRPSPAAIAAKRHDLGLDRPFLTRLGEWLGGVWRGNFGRSWHDRGAVWSLIWPRIQETLLLGGLALAAGVLLAIAGGVGSALLRGRLADGVLRVVASLVACVPPFVVGVLVIDFVVIRGGIGRVLADGSLVGALLPAAVLATGFAAVWLRSVRAIALDVIDSSIVRTARARGAGWIAVTWSHILPNVLLAFLPFIGVGIGSLLGATIVVEAVFSWPGIGPFAAGAAFHRDLPVLQAIALLSVVLYRLSTDIARGAGWLLDPRRRGRAR